MNVEKSPIRRSAIYLKYRLPRNVILGLLLTSLVILTPLASLRLMPAASTDNVEQYTTTQYSVYGPLMNRCSNSSPVTESTGRIGFSIKSGLHPAGNTKFGALPISVIDIITYNPAASN
jgi:hypothetical protein